LCLPPYSLIINSRDDVFSTLENAFAAKKSGVGEKREGKKGFSRKRRTLLSPDNVLPPSDFSFLFKLLT